MKRSFLSMLDISIPCIPVSVGDDIAHKAHDTKNGATQNECLKKVAKSNDSVKSGKEKNTEKCREMQRKNQQNKDWQTKTKQKRTGKNIQYIYK